MSTPHTASVSITNGSGGNAHVILFHQNADYGTQRAAWDLAPGATGGPMTVSFKTGIGSWTVTDWWSVMLFVKDGPNAGLWVSSGTAVDKYWKECQLQSADVSQSLTFTVDASQFVVALKSGPCTGGMTRLTPATTKPISHVFVVMLENHSFDNIFAMAGIPGLIGATTANSNSYDGTNYPVTEGAPLTLTTDPGHEFNDVLLQLCGPTMPSYPGGTYPTITNGGFAASYATSTSEIPHKPPVPAHIPDIMACFDTQSQLGSSYFLASNFTICDQWFSSLPGPTWPNRFFVHGASSAGFDDSPTSAQTVKWELPAFGFTYPHGSIFDLLDAHDIPKRFYNDTASNLLSAYSDDPQNGSVAGAVAQVTSLHGVTLLDVHSLRNFAQDLQGPYPYPYTFIEPHYGDLVSGTFAGGSSQHPMDDVYGGEALLKAVYEAIAQSPYWESSILIVTYDEHGGFYDSQEPPAAVAPGDNPPAGNNTHGFDFTRLGVRVPAVVASPLIPQGVDHTVYDHSSVPKLLEDLWSLPALTNRDAAANSPLAQVTLTTPRPTPTAAPMTLPRLLANKPALAAEDMAAMLALPIDREKANATLFLLRKADREVNGADEVSLAARTEAVRTRGDLYSYAEEVVTKVEAARQMRRRAAATPD